MEAEPSPVEVRDLGTATKAAGVADAEWDEGLGCGEADRTPVRSASASGRGLEGSLDQARPEASCANADPLLLSIYDGANAL